MQMPRLAAFLVTLAVATPSIAATRAPTRVAEMSRWQASRAAQRLAVQLIAARAQFAASYRKAREESHGGGQVFAQVLSVLSGAVTGTIGLAAALVHNSRLPLWDGGPSVIPVTAIGAGISGGLYGASRFFAERHARRVAIEANARLLTPTQRELFARAGWVDAQP
jgi:hypothetical protein